MAKKSLISRLNILRPLICAGLVTLAGIQDSELVDGHQVSREDTLADVTRSQMTTTDIYQNMSPEDAIKYVDSYDKAKDYVLNHLTYKDHTSQQSFEETHLLGSGVCRDASRAVLSLLSDDTNKYRVYLMLFEPDNTSNGGHVVALVYDEDKSLFGSLGINKIDCIEPTSSVKEVYEKIANSPSFEGQFSEDYCDLALFRDATNMATGVKYNLKTEKVE